MNIKRMIKRNQLKKEIGSNNISERWQRYQVEKYGVEEYIELRNSKRKVVKMSSKRSHHVGPKLVLNGKVGITEIQSNK